jgi:predicted membrane-bound mannosyltransferase
MNDYCIIRFCDTRRNLVGYYNENEFVVKTTDKSSVYLINNLFLAEDLLKDRYKDIKKVFEISYTFPFEKIMFRYIKEKWFKSYVMSDINIDLILVSDGRI